MTSDQISQANRLLRALRESNNHLIYLLNELLWTRADDAGTANWRDALNQLGNLRDSLAVVADLLRVIKGQEIEPISPWHDAAEPTSE
jgi:hypothetical protein